MNTSWKKGLTSGTDTKTMVLPCEWLVTFVSVTVCSQMSLEGVSAQFKSYIILYYIMNRLRRH
ncbi:hypothetical protein Plhal304r1_c027g0091761 [Plasmopara halstedii]